MPPLNSTSALGRLVSGMLNWLTEGVTSAGLENKLCLVMKVGTADLDLQTGQELSASSLCYRSSLTFHGQARCGSRCISQDPQSIGYSTQFVCGFGSSGRHFCSKQWANKKMKVATSTFHIVFPIRVTSRGLVASWQLGNERRISHYQSHHILPFKHSLKKPKAIE